MKDVSLHEAAHCYRAWAEGCILFQAKVGRSDLKDKREGFCSYGAVDGLDAGEKTLRDIRIWLAAPQAEKFLMGGSSSGGHADALRVMNGLLEFDRFEPLRRLRSAARSAASAGGKKEKAESFMVDIRGLLPGIDGKGKRAIRALAKELDRRGELSGADCAIIMEKAHGERPEKALPVTMHRAGPPPTTTPGLLIDALEKVMAAEKAIRDQSDDDGEFLDILGPLIECRIKLIGRLKDGIDDPLNNGG